MGFVAGAVAQEQEGWHDAGTAGMKAVGRF